MLTFLDVKGAATDASAIDKEIPEISRVKNGQEKVNEPINKSIRNTKNA